MKANRNSLFFVLLAFVLGITAALYLPPYIQQMTGVTPSFDDEPGTQLAQLFGKKSSAATPTPKPIPQAAEDLRKDPPLDLSKVGEALPRNLFVELSKLINPAVVSISTEQTQRRMGRNRGGGRDPMREFFEDFWGLPPDGGGGGPRGPGGGGRGGQQMMAMGSGFIIRADGLIITNNHVIQGADVIKVSVGGKDDEQFEARVIGSDQRTDIALIKIDAKKQWPVAPLGTSANVQVGEWVAAFGNPYGHSHTMTKGIVSAINREISELGNRFPFIQTDASINPGNSGGPLVDSRGYVIGVNTAIDARAQGIGFAIPIDNVKTIIEQLEKDGRVRRGYIGVGIQELNPQVASQLGLKSDDGAIITEVRPGSPAKKAGVEVWDIITEFNGKKIKTPNDLSNEVGDAKAGASVKAKILRFDNERRKTEKNLTIVIGDAPDAAAKTPGTQKRYMGQKAPYDLGFKIADSTPQLRQDLGVGDGAPGPIITEVDRGSVAAEVGLEQGDVILDVNRQPTRRPADVIRFLRQGSNVLRVARGNMIAVIAIDTAR